MIYKFIFEVWDDDNKSMFCARSEESGNFWMAWTTYMNVIIAYIIKNRLDR